MTRSAQAPAPGSQPIPHDQLQLEILGHVQGVVLDMRELHRDLLEQLLADHQPATIETCSLTATKPIDRSPQHRDVPTLSIGVINPTAYVLRLGLNGGSAQPGQQGVPVPALSAIVLPVAVAGLEYGLDDPASIAGNTAVFYLLRFAAVQALFMSR